MESSWTRVDTNGDGALADVVVAPLDGPDSVDVPGFQRDATGVEFFRVRVRLGAVQYELRRRFSQFEAVARSMRTAARKHALPPKHLIRHTDENLALRADALEGWMRAVLGDGECASDAELYLWPFLELDAARALLAQALPDEPCAPSAPADEPAALSCVPPNSDAVRKLEAERERLRAELGDKASEVRRLEHGMVTAKALVATLRQHLVEAERSRWACGGDAPMASAPPAVDALDCAVHERRQFADAPAAESQPPIALDAPRPQLAMLLGLTHGATDAPSAALAPAAQPASPARAPAQRRGPGKAAKRKEKRAAKAGGDSLLVANARRSIASH
ncbi:hypothetical protein KFE25_010330 [Diacronema lutheri]|uniref:PX domain-containing protein n=1 Tax=Diacronema lutheri TaxID=2081491 RepID=A0A8J5XNL4_DIALT|nr:hypothetical protein KFE25_010330 [Diacronema lutheri]